MPFEDLFSPDQAAVAAAALLAWVALVYLLMGLGVRRGELVWSGRHPRLLPTELRVWSFVYALLLFGSGWVLLVAAGVVDALVISDQWMESATFVVAASLGVAFLVSVIRGSLWERFFFAPITLVGALIAGWLTFA